MDAQEKSGTADAGASLAGFDIALPDLAPLSPAAVMDEWKPEIKPAWEAVGVPKKISFKDKPAKRVFYDWSQVNAAVELLTALPNEGETIHAVMNSLFKGVDLAPAIQRLAGLPAKELIVTTLGFNRQDASCLCEMVERGEVKQLSLVCSNFFAEKDRGAFAYAKARFEEVGAHIAVSRNHSKLMLFDFETAHYTVESSANLRSCNNLEQFALTNSVALFDFHKSWVTKMF